MVRYWAIVNPSAPSPARKEFHRHARNSIKSLNAQVKADGTEDIETAVMPLRRRIAELEQELATLRQS